jgi:hypothetical protein
MSSGNALSLSSRLGFCIWHISSGNDALRLSSLLRFCIWHTDRNKSWFHTKMPSEMQFIYVTTQDFVSFWGNFFFVFVLLEMNEISQEYKLFESI